MHFTSQGIDVDGLLIDLVEIAGVPAGGHLRAAVRALVIEHVAVQQGSNWTDF